MSNGTSNYESLFDPDTVNVNTASQLFDLEAVGDGTALGGANDQHEGFQFGVNARPDMADAFDVHTRIVAPFAGMTQQDGQEMGVFVGRGDQDNYVKLVVAAAGVRFAKEIGRSVSSRRLASITLPGPDHIDLFLRIDPDRNTIRPSYSVSSGGTTTPRTNLGAAVTIPSNWFVTSKGGSVALAIGLASTSDGPAPAFPANWDFIEAVPT
jgi:hypothetical protein